MTGIPFELDWTGGTAEKHFRKLRPEVADLPWGTLDPKKHPAALIDASRVRWTGIATGEYRAAIAFSHLLGTLLEARVPLDIVGMASDFVADEVSHVEIAARVAMELGGGAPVVVNDAAFRPLVSDAPDALARAHEEVLRLACIHEVLSRAAAADAMRAVAHPLLREAERIIVRDEAMHVRLGAIYFSWASELLDDRDRANLARAATAELAKLSWLWTPAAPPTGAPAPATSPSGAPLAAAQVNELGWLDRETQGARLARAVREEIVPALAAFGVTLDLPPTITS
jgi:hypothetical protein